MSPEGSPHRHLNKLLVNAAPWLYFYSSWWSRHQGKALSSKKLLLLEFLDSYGPSFTKFQLNKKPAVSHAPPHPKKNLDLGSQLVKEMLGVCIIFALP